MTPVDQRQALLTGAGFVDTAKQFESERHLGTWGSRYGPRIDYVFAQSRHFDVMDATLVAEAHYDSSDHVAYYATVRWKVWL
jgi:exonuclease III